MKLKIGWLFSHQKKTHGNDKLARILTLSHRNFEFDTKGNLRLKKSTALVGEL